MPWNPSRLLGVRLNLYLGVTRVSPAPGLLAEALQDVEVELADEGNDGFQMTFGAGRKLGVFTVDSPVFTHPLLLPFTRVALQVSFGAQNEFLIDGFITHRQSNPSDQPGRVTMTVTGEDIRVKMDLEERTVSHVGLSPNQRVQAILARYQDLLGLEPQVHPPRDARPALHDGPTPIQNGTDLQYMRKLATDSAFVFYVEPDSAPNRNFAYWGPPPRVTTPQPALTVNMGPDTNAKIQFHYDALRIEQVDGAVLDPKSRELQQISEALGDSGDLGRQPALAFQRGVLRKSAARYDLGGDYLDAVDAGKAAVRRSRDAAIATADIDVAEYGRALRPRRLVGVRGAGRQLDGLYYVKRVTHAIRRGSYTQRCTLSRDSVDTLQQALPT